MRTYVKVLMLLLLASFAWGQGVTCGTKPNCFPADLQVNGPLLVGAYTIGASVHKLPAASTINLNYFAEITDGVSSSDCVTGGGSFQVLCLSNGSVWGAITGGGTSPGGWTYNSVAHTITAATGASVSVANTVLGTDTLWTNNRPLLRDWNAAYAKVQQTAGGIYAVDCEIGDSWVDQGYITNVLQTTMQGSAYVGGVGWVGASTNVAAPTGATRTITGTWTDGGVFSATPGPDGFAVTTTDTATPAMVQVISIASYFYVLYLEQPNGMAFRWQTNGNGWTTVTTAGATAVVRRQLVACPSYATCTLQIEPTGTGSAGLILYGVDARNSAGGVVVHKIGHGGAQASSYLALNPTMWASSVALLGCNVASLRFGVNEAGSGITPAAYSTSLTAMAAALTTALPTVDIMLASQSDIGTSTTYPMSAYVTAAASLASASGWGWVNNYGNIGTYAAGNARGLYSNTSHPDQFGGALMALLERTFMVL